MKKALVIGDHPYMVDVLSQHLETAGFSVISAKNSKQGVTKAIKENPHLILIDILMPEMDGLIATRNIRSNPQIKDIPILVITVIFRESELKGCMEAGCNDYISKPFTANDLQEKIQAVLDPPRDKQ